MIRSVVIGSGAAKPRNVVTNADLESKVDTTDEWIQQRTGIKQRYIAEPDETTASLGEAAARAAMADAGVEIADIDLIILATSTPNNTFPASAVDIQNRLGMKHGAAFDLQGSALQGLQDGRHSSYFGNGVACHKHALCRFPGAVVGDTSELLRPTKRKPNSQRRGVFTL